MNKKQLVEKVAKEQNLDPEKLSRLSVAELRKMDLVVPDDEDLGEDNSQEVDIFEEEEIPGKESQEEDHQDIEVVAEAPVNVGRRLVGHNPITKEPIYK